jgi:nitroreductase family protein
MTLASPAPPAAADLAAMDDFWEASSFDELRMAAAAARMAAYPEASGRPPAVDPLMPATAAHRLRTVRDRTHRLLAARRSRRTFGRRALSRRQLERILASVGPAGPGRRTVPEAGGIDVVHAYAIVRRGGGPLAGSVVRYDHRRHAVHHLGPVPGDDELRRLFQLADADLPDVVVAFVLDVPAVTAKYGARGGRFALQQAGHAAQNVGIRLAADRLAGYMLGGGLDREVLALLGVAQLPVRYGGAMAAGRRSRPRLRSGPRPAPRG